ncbi:hypothetical protein Hypma_010170 [Hypsizygus marmoreus]|uniref:Uncharacterized protein n=1 Tax=Hypsizygus marmoreus TaxID=39966 RepID=A0A369JPP3_HYPMA|nr:hypothetical protein Hypma_010170 [Hypsizygus marmoreus]
MPLPDIKLVTPKDLVDDPMLLLHKRGLDETRTVFDGKVGSVIGDRTYFVMSPNMSHTFAPPLGNSRQMRMCNDGCYTDDDHLVGPQPYSATLCHYAAIPRKLRDPYDPLAIMWWVPTKMDFDFATPGLGKLDPMRLGRLGGLIYSIKQEVEKYKKDDKFTQMHKSSVISLFGVALLQRSFLELKAYLDYLYIFRPRMTGQEPPATDVAVTIGAYAFNDVVAQEFVCAGLPVWIIKSYSYLPAIRIDSVVPPLLPKEWAVLEDANPPYLPFFTGSVASADKYTAFHSWARRVIGYPNPFASLPEEPASLPPSSAATSPPLSAPARSLPVLSDLQAGHSSHQKSRAKTVQPYLKSKPSQQGVVSIVGRNKFVEPLSSLCPPPIATWSKALAHVDRDRRHWKSAVRPSDAGYVFPDPGLVIGISDAEKLPKYIHNWLKYRGALLFRMSSQGSAARPISPQLWRMLLNYGGQVVIGDGRHHQRCQQIAEILASCIREQGLHLDSLAAGTTSWHGRQFESDELPPQRIIQEVVWELFELNFCFEFVGLDSRASEGTGDTLEGCQRLIMSCFPGRHGGSMLIADVEAGDSGVAAAS